jgi:DNA-binding IscR family transcriptional regulator
MESTARAANMESRIILGLSVAAAAARAMLGSERGFDAAEFAASRRVPVRFLNGVIEEMVEAGLLAELSDARGRFVLLRSPEQLRVREVIGALMASGVRPAALGLDPADPKVGAALAGANRGMEASLRDSTVRDLL